MSRPFRPVEYYAPAGASLALSIAMISRDLLAVRDLLLPMLDKPTHDRLCAAAPGEWREALSDVHCQEKP